MTIASIFYCAERLPPPERLVDRCTAHGFTVQGITPLPALGDFSSSLPSEPHVLFIPAIEEDCLGVKLAQCAIGRELGHVVHLYASALPGAAFMATAFREGVAEILTPCDDEVVLALQLRRAARKAQAHWHERASAGRLERRVEQLEASLQAALRRCQRRREREAAVVSAALRLARGELNLSTLRPLLLLVTGSDARAERAQVTAEELGFVVERARQAEEALQRVAELQPTMILCDGEMNDMDANAFSEKARRALGRHPVFIVAWSSRPDADQRYGSTSRGPDDWVQKDADDASVALGGALLSSLR